ncbi:hypothetical protein NLG97_g5204 [Lecanicillium saksenae]|uniref:Uncharacterized protein n=1 Tax=Lecanicillium saksenae TaxID=468837 RepID=A0ACC1QT25_9HYPO|nr:hypothetical protein NLG97_g5204 [Lecanicillium saksenae]
MSDYIRIAALSAEIAQVQQEIEYWKLQEQSIAAELARSMAMMRQYTQRGQMPDPMVQAAVNNHAVALNRVRSTITQLWQRKASKEQEQADLQRRARYQGHSTRLRIWSAKEKDIRVENWEIFKKLWSSSDTAPKRSVLIHGQKLPLPSSQRAAMDPANRSSRRDFMNRIAYCHESLGQCDLGFPQCQRCIDLRLVCPGPRVGAFFVHAQADASQQPAPAPPSVAQVHQALTRIPPAASALRACRANAFDQLFVSHFIESFGLPPNVSAGPTWLERLPSFLDAHGGGHALATTSIRSASMLSYGTWARDEAIQADSYRWYASALTQLGRSVGQGGKPVAALEMAVCAAVMLIHFETWAGTSRNAWVHHVKGAASLLVLAGPESCRRGFLQSVFSHLRFQVFIASMQENTLHAFADPEWLDVPFREQGKNLFDELVDALFSVQRCLFVMQEGLRAGTEKDEDYTKTMQLLMETATKELSEWDAKYMAFMRPACWARREQKPEAMAPDYVDFVEPDEAEAAVPGLPESALMSLFYAGRLIVAQLAATACGTLNNTAHEDSYVLLNIAGRGEQSSAEPSSKLRPFMMLPGLKIASVWSPLPEVRSQARALLLNEQILISPMADIALTSGNYFSDVANSILGEPKAGIIV